MTVSVQFLPQIHISFSLQNRTFSEDWIAAKIYETALSVAVTMRQRRLLSSAASLQQAPAFHSAVYFLYFLNILFSFCSVPPLAPQPVITQKKEQFPFPPGLKRARMAVNIAQPRHPRPPLLSSVSRRVRSEDAMPSPVPPAQPWSQVSVTARTQTPLRNVPS